MAALTIHLNNELYASLKEAAHRHGQSMQMFIVNSIQAAIDADAGVMDVPYNPILARAASNVKNGGEITPEMIVRATGATLKGARAAAKLLNYIIDQYRNDPRKRYTEPITLYPAQIRAAGISMQVARVCRRLQDLGLIDAFTIRGAGTTVIPHWDAIWRCYQNDA